MDAKDWVETCLSRFKNAHIEDQVLRLTEDSTNRIEAAVMEMLLATPAMAGIGAVLLGAWIRYHTAEVDEAGAAIARTPDARAQELLPLLRAASAAAADGLGGRRTAEIRACRELLVAAFGDAAGEFAPAVAEVLAQPSIAAALAALEGGA